MPFNLEQEWKPTAKQAQFLAVPWSIKEALFGGGAGSGKCLSVNTPILTSLGFKKLEDIKVLDLVYDDQGEQTFVIAVSEIMYDHECYEMTFDDGSSIVCDADHNWPVLSYMDRRHNSRTSDEFRAKRRASRPSRSKGKRPDVALRNQIITPDTTDQIEYQIKTTREILDTMTDRNIYSVVNCKSLVGFDHRVIVDPYVLGVWLGDGNSSNATITIHPNDIDIINKIKSCGCKVSKHSNEYGWGIWDLEWRLEELKIKHNKHIPINYFYLSESQRLELLCGLMDTDGTVNEGGNCVLGFSNEQLANDAYLLMSTLGIKVSRSQKPGMFKGVEYKMHYMLAFSTEKSVFHLTRKKSRQDTAKRSVNNQRYIKSIEKVDSVPVKCITVDSKSHLYLAGTNLIPTHNSELLLMLPIVHGFHKHPEYKQVLLRRTTKQLKKEIVPRSQEIYPKFGGTFNESDMLWTFPREDQFGSGAKNSGAKVYLGHCENDKDVHIYDSMQINVFSPDEITSLSYAIYTYIALTRVRSSTKDLPAVIRAAGMPGDIGHGWTKVRFIDPAPAGGKILVGKAGIKRVFIHATLLDNKHIDPDYINMLNALPEAEKQAKLYGSWDAYLGQVFEEFRDVHYEDEPDNALHLIPEFDIPSWWPKIVAIDWGYNSMCSVGWAAVSPSARLYVYRHQMFRGKLIEDWAPLVKYYVEKDKPQEIQICHSAAQHRGDPHSILDQVTLALNNPVSLGVRDRISGKTLLHEYLRWKQKEVPLNEIGVYSEDRAAWIIRNKGLEEYHQYVKSFDTAWEPENNLPKIQFFDTPEVKVICEAIKACNYAKDLKDGKKVEDVAEFLGDDPYDMLRMLLHLADKFFHTAANKKEQLDQLQQIQQRFDQTQDMTSYYRNMKRVESNQAPKAVRLFHRGARR